jgi:Zn-dependent alcohol dehydrogenase
MPKTTLIIAILCVIAFSSNSYAVDFATKDFEYQTTSTVTDSTVEAAETCKCECAKSAGKPSAFKKALNNATETVVVTGARTIGAVAGAAVYAGETVAAGGAAVYDAARSGWKKLVGKE